MILNQEYKFSTLHNFSYQQNWNIRGNFGLKTFFEVSNVLKFMVDIKLLKYCVFSVKTFYVCGLGSRFYDQTMKAWKDTEKEVWEKGKGMKTNEADRFRETFRRHWIFELFKLQQTFFSVSWFHLLVSCERMLHSCYHYCDMNMNRFNIE